MEGNKGHVDQRDIRKAHCFCVVKNYLPHFGTVLPAPYIYVLCTSCTIHTPLPNVSNESHEFFIFKF